MFNSLHIYGADGADGADGRWAEIGWVSVLGSLGLRQKGEESLQLISGAVCGDESRADPHKPSSKDKVMTGSAGLGRTTRTF